MVAICSQIVSGQMRVDDKDGLFKLRDNMIAERLGVPKHEGGAVGTEGGPRKRARKQRAVDVPPTPSEAPAAVASVVACASGSAVLAPQLVLQHMALPTFL